MFAAPPLHRACLLCTGRCSAHFANAGSHHRRERSFIMLKPDAVQRGLVGKIIQRFEEKGCVRLQGGASTCLWPALLT